MSPSRTDESAGIRILISLRSQDSTVPLSEVTAQGMREPERRTFLHA